MNAHVPWVAGEGPLESLLAFHRRVERRLASLAALPGILEARGAGPETAAAASAVLHCLGTECAWHHAEEEHVLFPLMDRRARDPAERDPVRAVHAALAADHRRIEQAWRPLRRPLEAVAEGLARRLDAAAIRDFRALYSGHIAAEEASLHDLALRRLTRADLDLLRRRLDARRLRRAA